MRATAERSGWTLSATLLALLAAAPVVAVVVSSFDPRWEIWRHLAETQLLRLSWNTLRLLIGVLLGAGVLGVGLGWLIAVHRFPGRRFFEWALVLPMAVPAYVVGFVLVGTFDVAGPVQTWLRAVFGARAHLPDIRSWGGVVLAMSLVFFPYVYLLARLAFAERGVQLIEAARSLGQSPRAAFWRLALPLARPAIAAGLALVAMETLGDFGTVAVFGYDAFTTAVYRVWFGMFDRTAAGQIALLLMTFAALLVVCERLARGRARFSVADAVRARPIQLTGARAWLATLCCSAVLGAAFVLPAGVLAAWSLRALRAGSQIDAFLALLRNSLTVSLGAALLAVSAAMLLAYGGRLTETRRFRALRWAALLGYAAPGSVIAVGVLLLLAQTERGLAAALQRWFGITPGLLVIGSLAGLLFAYLVRFLAVAYYPVHTGLNRIPDAFDEAARALGAGNTRVLREVHAPLLRTSLLTGAVLVVVEVMKEMPMTMLIRPFGFDTLAVDIWQRTTEAMWVEAALPALSILLVGAILVAALTRLQRPRGGVHA
ncbi:MAG: ABC transporter permease [Longimicrobiales bacterium]